MKYGSKALTILLLSATLVSGCGLMDSSKTMDGLVLNGENISSKNDKELRAIIDKAKEKAPKELNFIDSMGKKHTLSMKDLGLSIDTEENVKSILKIGHSGNMLSDIMDYWEAFRNPKHISLSFSINEPQLELALKNFETKLSQPGQNASLKIENGKVVKVPAVVGQKLDYKALIATVKEQAKNGTMKEVTLPIIDKAQPEIKDEDLAPFTNILGEYTTYYDAGAVSRSNNINLAAQKVNQLILKPGDTFSFNQVVGERTAKAGYDDAPVFMNGKLVPGIGGGICQVSSTLYATALYSGLEIVDRTAHFAPVGYTELGLDATVSYGSLDLVFRNSLPRPVYIYVVNGGGVLSVYFIGAAEDQPTSSHVRVTGSSTIAHQVIERIDPSVKETVVEEGHDGMSVTAVRSITYGEGRSVEDVHHSYYDPLPTIITKNKKDEPKPVKPPVKKEDSKEAMNPSNKADGSKGTDIVEAQEKTSKDRIAPKEEAPSRDKPAKAEESKDNGKKTN